AAARGHVAPLFGRPAAALAAATRQPHGEEHAPYYMRVMLADAPGMLAKLAAALGSEGVSIQRMHQYDGSGGRSVPVVLITHDAPRPAVDAALERIHASGICDGAPVAMRIETV
ncbi:MAG: ACT domain-containing protein, partial [Pseudomonadota bacterium]